MDATDRKILAELQRDGRQSLTDLGERVGISLSPVHRRLRALEDEGVVTGYRAIIDPPSVGLHLSAIVFVTLEKTDGESVAAFEASVAKLPAVIQALRLFGDPDYLLNVLVADITAFQRLYDERLSRLPSVARLRSTLVMKTVVQGRALPI